jgi:hypothetical protein
MRSKMTKVRLVLSSLLAVLALTAIAASAAQAATAEGPFYKITGTRLLEGKTKEVTAKGGRLRLWMFNGEVEVECSSMKFASGAKLLGSTGANYAGATATLELSGCTAESSDGICELSSSTIKTEPLTTKLAYPYEAEKTRTGPLEMIFGPTKPSTGIAHVTFTGNSCPVEGTWPLNEYMAGYIEVGGKHVEVGKEPAAGKVLQVTFSTPNIERAWLEKSGTLEKKYVDFETEGYLIEYEGTLELEAGGAEWGVFT